MRRAAVGMLVTFVVAVAAVACGDDGDGESTPRPPNDFEELAGIFDPTVEPMGLRVTRASLVDSETYDESDDGNHLALYVEPTGAYSRADYVDGVTELTNLLTPMIFERFAEIESYDVCQEPAPEENDERTPPPVSQVFVTRDQAAAIDFPVTLEKLRALYAAQPRAVERLYVDDGLAATPEWKAAAPAA